MDTTNRRARITRAGYKNLRIKRRKALADADGEFIAQGYRDIILNHKFDNVADKLVVLDLLKEQAAKSETVPWRKRVKVDWPWALMFGGAWYVALTFPALDAAFVGLAASAGAIGHWTLTGHCVMNARKRRAARRARAGSNFEPVKLEVVRDPRVGLEPTYSNDLAAVNSCEPQQRDLISDVLKQRLEGENGVWCTEENPELLERLQKDWTLDDAYRNWNVDKLTAEIKKLAESKNLVEWKKRGVMKDGTNANGYYWSTQLEKLL